MSNMVVQTNVLALNSHRNMKGIGVLQSRASGRLSSGFKINSAADDAAGLAISEKMRGQIRGLDMASKNAQDASSLIQTAEGGMQEIDNMVQRIRELIVYAANDTQDAGSQTNGVTTYQGDRQKIQDEISSLMKEIDSMSERVEFNKKKLINGDFAEEKTPAVAAGTQDSTVDAAALKQAKTDGKITTAYTTDLLTAIKINKNNPNVSETATVSTTAATASTAAMSKTWTFAFGANQSASSLTDAETYHFLFNGEDVKFTAGTSNDDSIDDLASKFAAHSDLTDKFTFTNNNDGSFTITQDFTKGGWTAGHEADEAAKVVSNDTIMNDDQTGGTIKSLSTTSNTAGTPANSIAGAQTKVAVTVGGQKLEFSYDGTNLRKADGTVPNATNGDNVLTDDAGNELTFDLDQLKQIADATHQSNLAQAGIDVVIALDQTYLESKNLGTVVSAQDAVKGDKIWFQVGANADQGWSLNIAAMNCKGLGLADAKIEEDGTKPGNGKDANDTKNTGVADPHSLINVLQFTGNDATAEAVTKQLNLMDEALTKVTTERSKLGAAQNRLEYTMKSLDTTSENLSASESRIRDTDMAKEMMNLTKANVLNQAAISMLAQANQAPQSVLQLLQ